MSRFLVAVLVVLGHAVASAQFVVPKDWKRLPTTPQPDSEIASCAAQGGGALFRVALNGSRLSASLMEERDVPHDAAPYELDWAAALDGRPTPAGVRDERRTWAATYAREHAVRVVVPVDDGYLIGFGGGEFGGSLWWYPRQPGPGRSLAQAVVKGIAPTPEPGTYIVLIGLAHMGTNEGAALWVDRNGQGQWRIRTTVPLHSSPYLHATRPDGILMADHSTVDLLIWSGELRTLHRSRLATLPASFAFAATGEIVIGRSVLVNVLRPTSGGAYKEEWFLPKECQRFTYWRGVICECAGARQIDVP